jgi:ribulose-phosphate 3-epimerase
MKIIPAILPKRFYEIENAVEKIAGSTHAVQIDFVDGFFAPNRTWWFNNKDEDRLQAILSEDEGMPEWSTMNYELDLMVKNPLSHIDTFMALGPARIIFHVGSFEEKELISYFETLPEVVRQTVLFGIALSLDDDPALAQPYIDYIDTIQCMGIAHVGYQGQDFDERVFEKIQKVKEVFPDKRISVDGGVSLENASQLIAAGANVLIVGSAIFESEHPRATLQEFKTLLKEF